jgi:hypothetical protein
MRHVAQLTTSFKTRFFTVNPEIRYTDRWYMTTLRQTYFPELDSLARDTVPGFRRVGEMSLGANLTSKLYGTYTFRGERVQAIRHVITPTVGFNYRPDIARVVEGPFGPGGALDTYSPYGIGIFGAPPRGESGMINLGLLQNLEAKVRDAKGSDAQGMATKKIRIIDFFGINTNYDILRDSVRWSPVNLSARTIFFNRINVNYVSLWDPYAVNELGQRIDQTEWALRGRLARMNYTNWAVGFDVKSPRYGQAVDGTPAAAADRRVVEDVDPSRGARIDFRMPWRMGINFSHDITRNYFAGTFVDDQRTSVLVNGDITVFRYWKLGATSGYDMMAEEFTPTALNLYWDLHCWEFNLNVIPIGLRRSFTFRINVKASVLNDLKFEQRRPIGTDGDFLY